MKSARIFVKSNYIKNAKDNWVFCDGRLLFHQNITFLHLKSINMDRNFSLAVSDYDSSCGTISTLLQMQRYRNRSPNINVLCNLHEFKSCEIKSVTFEYVSKFAIKLVPTGFLSSKKLYLIPDAEDTLTKWCGLITGLITKSIDLPISNFGMESQDSALTSPILKSERTKHINDVYISLDENDAYETTSQNEFHMVVIEPSADSLKLKLEGRYIMKLGIESLDLLNPVTQDAVHIFPYSSIRRFGAKNSIFKLEAGRRCSTGHGSFTFLVKDAPQIAEKVKQNARQLKTKRCVHSSCMTLNRPAAYDVSLQVETQRNGSLQTSRVGSMNMLSLNREDSVDNEHVVYRTGKFPSIYEDFVGKCRDDGTLNGECGRAGISETKENEDAFPSDDFREESCDLNPVELSTINIRNIKLSKEINRNTVDLGRCLVKCQSYESPSTSSKELRPTSLLDSPLQNASPNSPSIIKSMASSKLSDYSISGSTFFKYRQSLKSQIEILPSLPSHEVTTLRGEEPRLTEPGMLNRRSSDKSPPPIKPKPKLRMSEKTL